MLSEFQIRVLKKVRKRIDSFDSHFICAAINHVSQEPDETPYERRFIECAELKRTIGKGIDYIRCVEPWLFAQTGYYPEDISDMTREMWNLETHMGWKHPVSREQFNNWCALARVAWIDRALEQGALA
jgi:hypothetical protein